MIPAERQQRALERLKCSTWNKSRAKRTGSQSREEWQSRKDADIAHLEALIYGRTTSGARH